MRKTHPEAERPFRVKFVPLVPILGIASCLLLMFSLPSENWLRLFVWLGIGFLIYFFYGRKHSALARLNARPDVPNLIVPQSLGQDPPSPQRTAGP
jgi:APA family basic amino acid/polyamine antiporter